MARQPRAELPPSKVAQISDEYLGEHDQFRLYEVWGEWAVVVSGDPAFYFEDELDGSINGAIDYLEATDQASFYYQHPHYLATVSRHPDLL